MNQQANIRKSALAALCTVFLWASAFPATKYLLDYYSAESLSALRFLIAAIVLLIIAIIKRSQWPALKDLPYFALAGFLGIFLYSWLFITGMYTVPSGVSSFLIASAPVFAALMSIPLLKERVPLLSWVGIAVSFVGVGIITLSQMYGFELNSGVFLLLAAAISTSLYTIIQRKLMKKYTPLEAVTYAMICGALYKVIFIPSLVTEIPTVPIAVNLIPLYLGIFPAALAYLAWSYSLSYAKNTASVTIFLYLIPFVTLVLSYLLIGESISPLALVGGTIIIAGMLISGSKKATAHISNRKGNDF